MLVVSFSLTLGRYGTRDNPINRLTLSLKDILVTLILYKIFINIFQNVLKYKSLNSFYIKKIKIFNTPNIFI